MTFDPAAAYRRLIPLGDEVAIASPAQSGAIFGWLPSGAEVQSGRFHETLVRPFVKVRRSTTSSAGEHGAQASMFPSDGAANVAIGTVGAADDGAFAALVVNVVPDAGIFGPQSTPCWIPFLVYDAHGTNPRENITEWAVDHFRTHYKDPSISKWSIFDYVYGILHHPGYRETFAENLKRELPRIPLAPDFRAFQTAGQKLTRLHLDYATLDPWELEFVETPGVPPSYRVEDKMRLSKDKTRLAVNRSLTLAGIPPEAFEYRLGNRSALESVIDQYQVSTASRSGIVSDPNREDDPQYIVRLVGQVIRVSVETVGIVKRLPEKFA